MARRKKLLIIEDEGLVALDLKSRLENAGYGVTAIVDNMEDAIASASADPPDLALADIRIKGEHDGIETAERLRNEFDVPAIFVTAYGDSATLERAKLAEPFGYVLKPFVGVDFHAQIEIVLWKHEMERKLRRSEAWLSAVVHNVGDAVIATDEEGRVAAINAPATELTGWDTEDAKGRPLLEVFSAFDHETGSPLLTPLETLYQGGQLALATQQLLLRNRQHETFRLIEARISPNQDADKLLGVIVVFRDITERSRTDDRDRQTERMRAMSALGAGVGRELQEILAKIAFSLNSKAHSEIPVWLERAQNLARQVADIEETEIPSHRAIDLNQLLESLKPRFQELFGGLREVRLSTQGNLPPIDADPKGLKRALLTAMSELHSLMRRKGSVQLTTSASRDGRHVMLSLEDVGKPPKLAKIEAASPEALRCLPMLAKVHYYMALEGGELRVSNRTEGGIEGSTLTFVFPAAATTVCALGDRKTASEKTLKAG